MRTLRRRRRMAVWSVVLGLAVAGCAELQSARTVVAPYYAKELCSCVFVVGQPTDTCLDHVRHDLAVLDDAPIIDTDDDAVIDTGGRTVTVALLLNRATARYQNERLGCRLEP